MSELRTHSLRHNTATGDPNIEMYADGSTSIRNLQNFAPNLVTNGGMEVSQRGGGQSTDDGYLVDMFCTQMNGATFEQEQRETNLTHDPFTQDGLRNYIRMENTTASTAAGTFRNLYTTIEARDVANSGWNYRSANSNVTISFWVRASVSQVFYASLQTFQGTARCYRFAFTPTADTWTKITRTIPGNANLQFDDTSQAGLRLNFAAFWGTTNTTSGATVDAWDDWTANSRFPDMATNWANTAGATFDVTGVQLTATDAPIGYQHENFGVTLKKCQRYLMVLGTTDPPASTPRCLPRITGVKSSGTQARMSFDATGMLVRASPSITVDGTTGDLAISVTDGTSALSGISGVSGREGVFYFVATYGSSSATNGSPCFIVQASSNAVRIIVSAEL